MIRFICGRHPRLATCVAAVTLLSACSTPPMAVGSAASTPDPALGQAGYSIEMAQPYALHKADELSVRVFREPELSVEKVAISAEGTISLPLIGTTRAEGFTTAQLQDIVTGMLLEKGIKKPVVSINVVDYASHLVTVEGAVTKAGVYPFQPGARLSSAIALANGTNRVAQLDQVAIFRRTAEGLSVARFDYAAVRRGAMLDPVIMPGDRVVVGFSGLSQFWQDLLQALPAFALFTRI